MSTRVLIAGYFGCGNLGDDAILLGFLEAIQNSAIEPRLLSGAPEESHRMYGLHSYPRKDMAAVSRAINDCDILVFPGGSIFQDVTSLGSVLYYSNLVGSAKKAGKRVLLLGQGVGPLNNFIGKSRAAKAFNQADAITVRDQASAQTLKSLGVKATPRIAGDFAFLLPKPSLADDSSGFSVGQMRAVGLAPRPVGKNSKEIIELFAGLSRMLFQNNLMPVLVEMDRADDAELINAIEKAQGGKIPSIRKVQNPMQLQAKLARMDAIIAMRLHAGILATTVDVPPFMVSYDPKVTAFASAMELPPAPSFQGLTPTRLYENFVQFHKDRERYLRSIQRRREEQAQAARISVQTLLDFAEPSSDPRP